jgi:hypothetical protein
MMDIAKKYPGLIEAMVQKECEGDYGAIGDLNLANKAYGPLQIRQPYCDDAGKILGYRPRATKCLNNLPLSIEIMNAYMTRFATRGRLGHEPTAEDIARIHNGGPNGFKIAATHGYWHHPKKGVLAILQKQGIF